MAPLNVQLIALVVFMLKIIASKNAESSVDGFNRAIGDFAISSLKTPILADNFYEENKIFSPVSIMICTAMVYVGSASGTKMEISRRLYNGMNEQEIVDQIRRLLEKSNSPNDDNIAANYTLQLTNSLIVQRDMNISVRYMNKIKKSFKAEIYGVDFANDPDRAKSAINEWIDQTTKGKIKNMLSNGAVTSATKLLLLNAIYFKSDWFNQFKEDKNIQMPFYPHPSAIKRPEKTALMSTMMRQMGINFWYNDDQERKVTVLGIPYSTPDLSFYIFLPYNSSNLFEFEKSLDTQTLRTLVETCKKRRVEVSIPKFISQSRIDLKTLLMQQGVRKLFESEVADLSPIDGTRSLYVSNAQHSAFIEVNEKGSEAAAASSLTISFRSAPLDEHLTFVADRPFIFAVIDRSNAIILFLGRYVYPSVN